MTLYIHDAESVSYDEAIRIARELQRPHDENKGSEFARGQIALIADLWGKYEMPTDERMVEVARDIYEKED